MKLSCKRIDFTYTPGEEIFNFPEESGLPFIFDVEEELTADPVSYTHLDVYKRQDLHLCGQHLARQRTLQKRQSMTQKRR